MKWGIVNRGPQKDQGGECSNRERTYQLETILREALRQPELSSRGLACWVTEFRSNEARLWLSLLAYNLGNLWRRLVLPRRTDDW
jgi:hypothetical protein